MKKTCSVYLTQNVSKNNFGLKFVQTISVFLKLTILKTLKLFLALSGRLMGYLLIPSNLSFCYLSSLAKSTNKTKIFTSLFIMKKKFVMKKTCSVYLTQNVSKKIILVWNLFKQISVFLKLTILKTLKLFLALSGRLMGYLKVVPSNLSFCYLSSLAKSTNKTKIFTSLFIMKKKFVMKKTCSVYLTQNVSKIILVWNLFKQFQCF